MSDLSIFAVRRQPARQNAPQIGVSLVELLVALVIGLVLMLGAVVVFVKARDTYAAMDTSSRMQETARYAFSVIETDARMAGFLGLNSQPNLFTNANAGLTDPAGTAVALAGCGANWATAIDSPATGTDASYSLNSTNCPAFGAGAQPATDTLVIRRASSTRIPQSNAGLIPFNGNILLATSRASGQIFVGDATGTIPSNFAQSDPVGAPPAADTRALIVNAYYVSRDSSEGVGYPSLRRKTLRSGPAVIDQEVIPGVDDLQVQYGVDINDDRNADRYVNATNLAAGDRVVALRVWLRVRARDIDAAFKDTATYSYANINQSGINDAYRRIVVMKTFQLRNSRA